MIIYRLHITPNNKEWIGYTNITGYYSKGYTYNEYIRGCGADWAKGKTVFI